MASQLLKLLVLLSAFQFLVKASAVEQRSITFPQEAEKALYRRFNGTADASLSASDSDDGLEYDDTDTSELESESDSLPTTAEIATQGSARGNVGIVAPKSRTSGTARLSAGASVSMSTMSYGFASLSSAFSKCQSDIVASASVEVAVQVVTTFTAQVQKVNNDYGTCACSGNQDTETKAQFQTTVQQFFSDFQLTIQAAQQRYPNEWNTHFSGVFNECAPAVKNVGDACSSARINLGTLLSGIHLDLDLFAGVGLNLSGLLGLNLNLGLGIGLLGL